MPEYAPGTPSWVELSERFSGVVLSATSASIRARGAWMFSIALDASVLWINATRRNVSRPAGFWWRKTSALPRASAMLVSDATVLGGNAPK